MPQFEFVRDFICNFHKDQIKTKQALLRTRSNMACLGTKGQVTPESIIVRDLAEIQNEILCLFRLSANLIKIRLKQKGLCSEEGRMCGYLAHKGK